MIAFKEWQVVCDALASGRQTILLRKGGIHEGRQGFSFAHESFFLFPTRFHAIADQVREGEVKVAPEWQPGDLIRITHYAAASWATTLTDWEKVAVLEPLHIYSEQTVVDRFDWEGKGMASGSIHLAFVRVYRLASPWEFPYETKYGGCRSWLDIPEPQVAWRKTMTPVLTDEQFEKFSLDHLIS
ncbi:MAG: DUF1802 family protein [Akkermansiaceae bacterium]|nr:DUF1802 family protein [Akkermansiaceae bacterium]